MEHLSNSFSQPICLFIHDLEGFSAVLISKGMVKRYMPQYFSDILNNTCNQLVFKDCGRSSRMIDFHSKKYQCYSSTLHSWWLIFKKICLYCASQSSVKCEINSELQQGEKLTLNFSRVRNKL